MNNIAYAEKPTYRSEVIAALRSLGGQGALKNIYEVIESRNLLPSIQINPNWQAQVRKQLQRDSSDAKLNESGKDIFFSVDGLHGGVWGIRDIELLDSDETYDYTFNGEYKDEMFVEGHHKLIAVNIFERNRKLRQKSLDIYGCDCQICLFNFEQIYGIRGTGFIEIHHIVPLSEMRGEFEANPADLRPVCSNCHSMIHRFRPFLTINEMKDIIAIQKSAS